MTGVQTCALPILRQGTAAALLAQLYFNAEVHMSNNGGPAPVPADYVNHAYCAGVENAGGIPILLPVLKDPADMDPVLAMCDGLLIPGGVDVDPRFYSEDPSPLLGSLDSAMDRFWIHAANYALEHKMPVLGICRGLQLVNVAFGGSLRSEERRVGKECLRLCRSRWSPYH